MKEINHNYWTGKHAIDADATNPDLRIAMQQLYGRKGFDFGKSSSYYHDSNEKNHCSPDGYSTYTILDGNYVSLMPFRRKAVENNKKLADRCFNLASTIAGEIFFPAHKLNGNSINQSRGSINGETKDMLHHTLESIKKYYEREQKHYPLKRDIERYGYFFNCFSSFEEYVEYNFLQDYNLLPTKFPTDENELVEYWKRSIGFLEARARRIEEYARHNDLFD